MCLLILLERRGKPTKRSESNEDEKKLKINGRERNGIRNSVAIFLFKLSLVLGNGSVDGH